MTKTEIHGALRMHTVRSKDGTIIAFRKSGSGPPLVLIHGSTADHTRWNPILPELEQRFTVYAVDRRGRGESTDAGEYAVEREFEDIVAVVDAIGQPVNLLGHSFGAFCALEATLLTENINKLILYEPQLPGVKLMSPDVANKIQQLLDTGNREGALSIYMLEVGMLPPDELEILRSLPAWPGRVAAAHTVLREEQKVGELPLFNPERFKSMETPTLLLLGDDSPPIFSDFIKQIDSALPNSTIVVMPGQRHIAMNTAPELFIAEVVRFLINQGTEAK